LVRGQRRGPELIALALNDIYLRRFGAEIDDRKDLWQILVRDFFQKFVGPCDTVLDLPCGYGGFINNVSCGQKIALDLNPDSAAHVTPDAQFLLASSTDIPLPDGSVDTVFISNFFEHLCRADITATIKECRRVLRVGGTVLVLQPNIRFAYRDYWMFLDHTTPVDDRMLEEAFGLAGFALRTRILRFLPFTAKSRIPQARLLVRAYLRIPLAWRMIGKQTFMVFEKLRRPSDRPAVRCKG